MDLKDRVALVTGASRGIGKGIAEKLASEGVKVAILSTKQERSQAVADELAKTYGVETLGLGADVSQEADCHDAVKAVIDQFGQLDILVNNAGIARDNLMLRMSKEDWDTVLRVNLDSVFHFTKAVTKPMLRAKFGRIINISSIVGVMGNPGQANYAASKAGVIGFTKSIAKELGAKGITANVVAPGFVETDMIDDLSSEYMENILAAIPQRRLGKVEDIAGAVAFLASSWASHMTGQVLEVDGGMNI